MQLKRKAKLTTVIGLTTKIKTFLSKISRKLALGMHRSNFFSSCLDTLKTTHKMEIYTDFASTFEFEIDLVANYVPFD